MTARRAPYNRAVNPQPANALYTVDQVRRLDRLAIETCGIDGFGLMQRAASAAFEMLRRRWPQARRLRVFAGNGNNGGDAFLLAGLARAQGFDVDVVALATASRGDAAARARLQWVDGGGRLSVAGDVCDRSGDVLAGADVVVDGLFGTGFVRALEGDAARLVAALPATVPVLALDVPSGLDADSGVARGPAVHATATVAFVGWKRGLFTADGPDHCGAMELATLDIPVEVHARIEADGILLDARAGDLPRRRANVNKGSFGHVLVIGGDEGMGGAVRLAGEAALRVGAGLVSVATRALHAGAIHAARPELIVRAADGPQSIESAIGRADVVALGPGLGQGAWGHALWDAALRAGKPVVVDADALNLLARNAIVLPAGSVLTPHPGEAARLLGTDVATIQRDRHAAVREIARRWRSVAVLKGAGSLVGAADGRVATCPFGNSGMASAGMGDVLTGIIAGLLAQGLDAWCAACAGVVLHARAGDRAAGASPRGLLAGDLFSPLRELANGAVDDACA